MYNITTSRHFTPWTDPQSGVVSYLFTGRCAGMHQSFYFTNRSMTDDGRYLWFYCAFPPSSNANYGRTLGVLDFETDTVTHFPETQFLDASPLVDTTTGEIYWCNHYGILKRSPDPAAAPVQVAVLPDELRRHGVVWRIATHLNFSADKRSLVFDAEIGDHWFLGTVSLETGAFSVWKEFDYCYNHAQLNPVDNDLILFAQDMWSEKSTGVFHDIENDEQGKVKRLFTIRRGEEPRYWPAKFVEARHEWWSPDGSAIYYVDWDYGTIRIDLATGVRTVIDPDGTWHAHCSMDERWFVADENEMDGTKWFRGCKSRVHFYNAETGKKVNIVTEAPALYTREHPCVYHIDPHPQFVCGDRYVLFTTTVDGRVDLCATEVSQLVERTRA